MGLDGGLVRRFVHEIDRLLVREVRERLAAVVVELLCKWGDIEDRDRLHSVVMEPSGVSELGRAERIPHHANFVHRTYRLVAVEPNVSALKLHVRPDQLLRGLLGKNLFFLRAPPVL